MMKTPALIKQLARDPFAVGAAIFLAWIVLFAVFGPIIFGEAAKVVNLRARNAPPFRLDAGWLNILGADALGRSIIARIAVAARNTLGIATTAVMTSLFAGGMIGVAVGLREGRLGEFIMRCIDVIMSFPSLLLALVVLYIFSPHPVSVVIVLAITRTPIYVRAARAEVLEIRERAFIAASRTMGGTDFHIIARHIVPLVFPTLLIIGGLDFAMVILAESALSFLGMGIQAPDITWGLMVASGRPYIGSAWWLSFWPGLMIVLTALSANLLASWFRSANDPTLRRKVSSGVANART
jgi:peptide/nickel transport system permease protein